MLMLSIHKRIINSINSAVQLNKQLSSSDDAFIYIITYGAVHNSLIIFLSQVIQPNIKVRNGRTTTIVYGRSRSSGKREPFFCNLQSIYGLNSISKQGSLSAALQTKNVDHFRHILSMTGVDPEKMDSKVSMSVFEKCCQTPGSAEFIKACVEWGCDVNKVNKRRMESVLCHEKHSVCICRLARQYSLLRMQWFFN